MAKKDELLELAQKQSEAVAEAELKAQEAAAASEVLNQAERDALVASQAAETAALGAYNQAQYKNQGEIISAAEAKMNEAKQMDETIYVAALYSSGTTAYYTNVLPYSLGAYCKNVSSTEIGAATAVYGYYAKAYFA